MGAARDHSRALKGMDPADSDSTLIAGPLCWKHMHALALHPSALQSIAWAVLWVISPPALRYVMDFMLEAIANDHYLRKLKSLHASLAALPS